LNTLKEEYENLRREWEGLKLYVPSKKGVE
jgi:hypothetical protein